MSSEIADAESKVSGNQANIPARIRRELDIDDGDRLRWILSEDGELQVEVVSRRRGTFSDFGGYDGDADTDATAEHDEWGLE